MASFTSTPTPVSHDTTHDVDTMVSWALLVATCLGVMWVYSPMNLRRCTTGLNDKQVSDLENGPMDPPTNELHDSKGCVPAAPGDKPKATENPKLYFIDNIKIFLTLLVVNQHSAQAFSGIGYILVESAPNHFNTIMSTLCNLNEAYFMAVFFLLSGYFVPSSLDRKGLRTFIKDKLMRLGLPAIMWFFGLGPLMIFLMNWAFGLASTYQWNPTEGPAWFIIYLLAFSIMYALSAQCCRCPRWVRLPGTCGLLALGLVLGVVQFALSTYFIPGGKYQVFLLNPYFAQTPFYLAFFAAGIAAKRNDWLAKLAGFSSCSLWALRSLSVGFAALIIFSKQWQELLTASSNHDAAMEQESTFWLMLCSSAVVQCLFGVVVSVSEIDLFHRCFNCGGGSIHRFFTDSIYGVYLLHYPFVQFFGWTYFRLILEQGLGKDLAYTGVPWCFMRIKCAEGIYTLPKDGHALSKDVYVGRISMTTPIDELHLWLGWAYTTVLTLVVVFPLAYFLKKLPVLRDIL
jgi:hypothetical protein